MDLPDCHKQVPGLLKALCKEKYSHRGYLFFPAGGEGAFPEEAYLEDEVRRELYENCKALKPPYDEVALDYYYYELDVGEIAAKREKNPKTVQTQIYRARGMLRKSYRKWEERRRTHENE